MKNILIIGCGLLGSSLLRRIKKKKLAKKIFIFEKSKKKLSKIKKLNLPGIIIKKPEEMTGTSLIIEKKHENLPILSQVFNLIPSFSYPLSVKIYKFFWYGY